jgi:hypothetical protein
VLGGRKAQGQLYLYLTFTLFSIYESPSFTNIKKKGLTDFYISVFKLLWQETATYKYSELYEVGRVDMVNKYLVTEIEHLNCGIPLSYNAPISKQMSPIILRNALHVASMALLWHSVRGASSVMTLLDGELRSLSAYLMNISEILRLSWQRCFSQGLLGCDAV